MRTTIDKAGRVVIPAGIREEAGLTAGAELEVTLDEFGVRLERVAEGLAWSRSASASWPVRARTPISVRPSISPRS